MFERETKREKILESRQRELRLKERTQSQMGPRADDENRGGRSCLFFYFKAVKLDLAYTAPLEYCSTRLRLW